MNPLCNTLEKNERGENRAWKFDHVVWNYIEWCDFPMIFRSSKFLSWNNLEMIKTVVQVQFKHHRPPDHLELYRNNWQAWWVLCFFFKGDNTLLCGGNYTVWLRRWAKQCALFVFYVSEAFTLSINERREVRFSCIQKVTRFLRQAQRGVLFRMLSH